MKVGNYVAHIKGLGHIKIPINYTSSNETFTMSLPTAVAEVVGRSTVFGDTKSKVEFLFVETIKKYEVFIKKGRKVILYKFMANADELNKEGICVYQRSDISFCKGTVVGLWWDVWEEVAYKDKVSYQTLRGHYASREGDMMLVEWTQERENFFRGVEAAMVGLAQRMEKFFVRKEDDMVNDIASGLKLLEAPRESKRK